MRWIISLILSALIAFLIYSLYISIKEPISFQAEKTTRKDKVTAKLEEIRSCQEIYRDITGQFAHNFDTLVYVLTNDSIPFVNIEGDPDDPNSNFTKTTTYSMAIDSIRGMGVNLDSLKYVPYSAGKEFAIQADTITYQQTNVPVVEVGTRWIEFMGEFASPKYQKYDNLYDPSAMLKFGDMQKPSLSGNW